MDYQKTEIIILKMLKHCQKLWKSQNIIHSFEFLIATLFLKFTSRNYYNFFSL
jgi:hypothetical protein